MSPLFVFPVWLNLDFIEVTKVGGKCSFHLKAIPDKSGSVQRTTEEHIAQYTSVRVRDQT